MSQFVTPFIIELVRPYENDGTGQWELHGEFRYFSDLIGREIAVANRTSTDLASVPKVPILYLLYGGRYPRPAAIHDYLCRQGYVRRELCDQVFLEAMQLENIIEIDAMRRDGADDEQTDERARLIEARAQQMYFGVSLYTKSGRWKKDHHMPGYEPIG